MVVGDKFPQLALGWWVGLSTATRRVAMIHRHGRDENELFEMEKVISIHCVTCDDVGARAFSHEII